MLHVVSSPISGVVVAAAYSNFALELDVHVLLCSNFNADMCNSCMSWKSRLRMLGFGFPLEVLVMLCRLLPISRPFELIFSFHFAYL